MVRNPADFPHSLQTREAPAPDVSKTALSSNFSAIDLEEATSGGLEFDLLPPEISEGDEVGGFKILEKLLTTSTWELYRAYQISRDREIALKVLAPSRGLDARQVERFKEEQRLTCSITQPGVLAGYHSGFDGRYHYIASKLMEGPRLDEFIVQAQGLRGDLFFRDAAALFAPLCHGVAELHAQGIVHRDIRPANLHLIPGDKIVLSNLGFALERDQDNARFFPENAPLEVRIYRAPECLEDETVIDPRSDVYSLALCFYELLTGIQPYRELPENELLRHKQMRKPPCPRNYLPTAPLGLEAILRQALHRDPTQRFQNAIELAREFERFASTRRPDARQHHGLGGYEDPGSEHERATDDDPDPDFALI